MSFKPQTTSHVQVQVPAAVKASVQTAEPERPEVVSNSAAAGLQALLKIEATAREARTPQDLHFIFANETRKLTGARQIFVFSADPDMRLVSISGLPAVDRAAPVVRGIESLVASLGGKPGHREVSTFDLSEHAADDDDFLARYPYQKLAWLPLCVHGGEVLGGMLLAGEKDWGDPPIIVARRMAATYAHALALLLAEARLGRRLRPGYLNRRKVFLALIIAALAAMAIPVPMTALAPLEITPKDPFIVAAPIEGVIEHVLVNPNEEVREGQPIVRFEDTALRNRLDIAERQVLVAEARLKKASQQAFDDVRGRHEIGLAMAEHALKTAEFKFAREILDRTTVRASRDGVAIFSDRQELIGKPVTLGERIMQIANPSSIEVTVDVDVSDSIVLQPGARAKIFLDSDPLTPLEAKVEFADYQARIRPGNTLAFQVAAHLTGNDGPLPRLGARGTAQLYGKDVPLAFYLFRRPLSALRQWTGL